MVADRGPLGKLLPLRRGWRIFKSEGIWSQIDKGSPSVLGLFLAAWRQQSKWDHWPSVGAGGEGQLFVARVSVGNC